MLAGLHLNKKFCIFLNDFLSKYKYVNPNKVKIMKIFFKHIQISIGQNQVSFHIDTTLNIYVDF